MHEMQTVVTDVSVTWCDSQSLMCLHPAEMAERIEVLFWVRTLGAQGTLHNTWILIRLRQGGWAVW